MKSTYQCRKVARGAAICAMLFAAFPLWGGEPSVEFPALTHDFGTIDENGGPVSHEFEFTNTGDGALMIINATASCGCTRPDYPKKPIAAGKKGKIKVTYLPAGRPGEFNKSVTVKTNAKKGRKVTLKIKGFVTPATKK